MSKINLTEAQVDQIILEKLAKHSPDIVVDEVFFIDLLKNSLSLEIVEKQKVIDAFPDLNQYQFDELTKVFLEEREKFRELAKDSAEEIKKLVTKQKNEWIAIWELYEMKRLEKEKAEQEQAAIDNIKSSLWL